MSNQPIPEESLSDRFDNTPHGKLSDLTPDQSKLVDEWALLRTCLQELPVSSASLVSDVRRQIDGASLVVATPVTPVQSPPRRSVFAVGVSSLTVAICLMSLMYFPAPLPNSVFQQSLLPGFTSSELVSGFSNCDVVVITMPDGPEETADFLRASLANRGMESHSIGVDAKPPSSSQLLGSNADSGEVLGALTALNNAIGGEPVDDMQREAILAQLLEAIETPSLAEEHFDEYVVVLPRDVINDMRNDIGAIAEADQRQNSDSLPADSAAESRKLVIVVRRKKVAGAIPAGNHPVNSNGASLQSYDSATGDAA